MTLKKTQRGFSLVTAIFLITALAALAAFVVVTSGVAQQAPVLGLRGTQAYHAARSGLEWGIASTLANAPTCTAGSNSLADFNGFDIQVNWTCTEHDDGAGPSATTVQVYVIESVATTSGLSPGQPAYATRTVRGVASSSGPL